MHKPYLFHDRAVGAVASVARALDARMEEGAGSGGEGGAGQGQGQGAAAGAQGSGTGGQGQGQQGDGGQGQGQGGQPAAGGAGKELTVEEWKARAREWEKRAKDNGKAAEELAALKKSQMSDLEKAQTEAAENKKLAEQAQLVGNRLTVAIAKGLPKELADRLQGTTVEEMEADADELLKLLPANGAGGGRTPDLRQGQRGGNRPEISGDDYLRKLAGRGRR